jgi:long-chain fatty acid transport protein
LISNKLTASVGTAAMILLPSIARAGGFVLNDHGARATGRADAVVATTADGSSIVHNPAGIADSKGVTIQIGSSLIVPSQSFVSEGSSTTVNADSPASVTPQLYITARVTKDISVGLGFHTPFGSRIAWPESSPSADEVRSQALRTFFITPVVAANLARVLPGLRVAAGVDLVPANVELKQDIFFGDTTGSANLGGNAFGVGGRVGLMYAPAALKALSLGVAYRSPVKLGFTGKGDFDAPMPYRTQLPVDGDISVDLTLPQQLSGGVAFRPTRDVELEVNAVWTDWSVVDKLDIKLPDATSLISPRDYKSVVAVRVGAEYALRAQNAAVRVGYMYDPTPVPSTRLTAALPDVDRHDISAGFSLNRGRVSIDLGALYVLPAKRKTASDAGMPNYKAEYKVQALVLAATVGVAIDP